MTTPSSPDDPINSDLLFESRSTADAEIKRWAVNLSPETTDFDAVREFVKNRQAEAKSGVAISFSATALLAGLGTSFYLNTQDCIYLFVMLPLAVIALVAGLVAQHRSQADIQRLTDMDLRKANFKAAKVGVKKIASNLKNVFTGF